MFPLEIMHSNRFRNGTKVFVSAALALLILGTSAALFFLWLGLIPLWPVLPWVVGLLALPSYVMIALVSAGLPLRTFVALAAVPYFFVLKLRVYTRLLRGLDSGWVRTERPAEKVPPRLHTP